MRGDSPDARDRRKRKDRERDAGDDQLRHRGAECFPVPRNDAVDQIETRHGWRRADEHVEPAERRRCPLQQEIEHIDQQQAGEENRQ